MYDSVHKGFEGSIGERDSCIILLQVLMSAPVCWSYFQCGGGGVFSFILFDGRLLGRLLELSNLHICR